jgi:hypothetical protein
LNYQTKTINRPEVKKKKPDAFFGASGSVG